MRPNIDLDPARFEPAAPERKTAKVDPKILDTYVGEYQFSPTIVITVTREGDRLFLTVLGNQQKFELFADTVTDFSVR